MGSPLATVQIRPNMPHHLLLIMGATPTYGVAFHIVVQILIRIQIRAVARQIKHPYSILMLLEPLLHLGRDMDRMLVNDQKDMTRDLTDQSSQEFLKHLTVKPMFKNHKVQAPPVGNRRNHIASETFTCPRDNGRLPTTSVRTTTGMVRSKPHFISPINLSPLLSGQLSNFWILLFQPLTHLLRILLEGSPHGLLRGEPHWAKYRPTVHLER